MTSGAGRFLILSIAPQYLEGLLQNSPTSFSIKAPLPRHPRWACTCVAARVCVCPLIGEAQLGLLFIPGPETQLALYSLSYQWLPCNERSQHNIARTSTSMTAQETQFSYDGTFSALAYILPTLYPFSPQKPFSASGTSDKLACRHMEATTGIFQKLAGSSALVFFQEIRRRLDSVTSSRADDITVSPINNVFASVSQDLGCRLSCPILLSQPTIMNYMYSPFATHRNGRCETSPYGGKSFARAIDYDSIPIM